MFWGLSIFIMLQLFFMSKGIENIPFFLYNMYGQQHFNKDSSAILLIKTTDGYFNHKKLSNRQQELLLNSVNYYINLTQNGDGIKQTINNRFQNHSVQKFLYNRLFNDSATIAAYPKWWGKYFNHITNFKYDSVSVVKAYIFSNSMHTKSNTDSLIFSIKLK